MKRIIGLLSALVLVSASPALAGGLILYEVGTQEVGLGSAGWAARAEDAATVLTNPAGMTRLSEDDLLLGLQVLYGDIQFTPDAQTTTTGSDGGNPGGWFPGGGVYYVHKKSDRVSLGIAMTSNFGLGLDYAEDWVGRYYVQKGTLIGVSVLPSVAWKVSDKFSVGLTLNAMYGVFDTTVAINNVEPSAADGQLAMSDNTWGFGGNLGLLYEPDKATRFGLTYTSPVHLDFGATPEFTGLGPGMNAILQGAGLLGSTVDLSMTVPQTAMASFVHDLDDRWTLLGNLGWQDWSAFGKVDVQISSTNPASLTVNENFKDTWHASIGAEVRTGPAWTLTFGTAYDSSCVDDADRTPTLPLGAAVRLGVGGRRPLSKKLDLGIAYELAYGGTLSLDQNRGPLAGRISGDYEDTSLSFFAANLRWKL